MATPYNSYAEFQNDLQRLARIDPAFYQAKIALDAEIKARTRVTPSSIIPDTGSYSEPNEYVVDSPEAESEHSATTRNVLDNGTVNLDGSVSAVEPDTTNPAPLNDHGSATRDATGAVSFPVHGMTIPRAQ